jgi:molybdenum cofactor cytidylyltransferase
MTPVGILLAAGRGKRFDPSGVHNKLLQPLADGEPVVVASARHLLAVLPRVLAVVRAGDDGVAAALRELGCDVTVCADADSGMAASLAHAVRQTSFAAGWLIALGDMPHLQAPTIRALCEALTNGAVVAAPVSQGRRGNPVAFSAACLPALLALEGDAGARAILHQYPVTAIDVDDPGIFHDIDTPSDLTQSKTS